MVGSGWYAEPIPVKSSIAAVLVPARLIDVDNPDSLCAIHQMASRINHSMALG